MLIANAGGLYRQEGSPAGTRLFHRETHIHLFYSTPVESTASWESPCAMVRAIIRRGILSTSFEGGLINAKGLGFPAAVIRELPTTVFHQAKGDMAMIKKIENKIRLSDIPSFSD
jgi:hypothetical protein